MSWHGLALQEMDDDAGGVYLQRIIHTTKV